MTELLWHAYEYYPYEREFALREVRALFSGVPMSETESGIKLGGTIESATADRLVYFSSVRGEASCEPTLQSRLENVASKRVRKRQSTRYSAHGIHEYKGKFNPQIVRALINILGLSPGERVLDPFCGSGTSLLECAHAGLSAHGTDLNPLAVYIANAKLATVSIPAQILRCELRRIESEYRASSAVGWSPSDARLTYLGQWFDAFQGVAIESLRRILDDCSSPLREIFMVIASNLLREYSLQDPNDLRIRRRKSALPAIPFLDAFVAAAAAVIEKIHDAQSVLPDAMARCTASQHDSRALRIEQLSPDGRLFDGAITSPPYATALPYIDTQRLSLVWLGLVAPDDLGPLEAHLVGSREVRGSSRRKLLSHLASNEAMLPDAEADYCMELQSTLGDADGFRRQATPSLLYRYFADMACVFRAVRTCVKSDSPFALIVGGNHTVLSGNRYDIDTPAHLASLASANGWQHIDSVPLQTYARFGYHMRNAVSNEALVVLRAT